MWNQMQDISIFIKNYKKLSKLGTAHGWRPTLKAEKLIETILADNMHKHCPCAYNLARRLQIAVEAIRDIVEERLPFEYDWEKWHDQTIEHLQNALARLEADVED
jgi:hypothetical protein